MFSALINSQFAWCVFFITLSLYHWGLYYFGQFRLLQNLCKLVTQINYNGGAYVLFVFFSVSDFYCQGRCKDTHLPNLVNLSWNSTQPPSITSYNFFFFSFWSQDSAFPVNPPLTGCLGLLFLCPWPCGWASFYYPHPLGWVPVSQLCWELLLFDCGVCMFLNSEPLTSGRPAVQ